MGRKIFFLMMALLTTAGAFAYDSLRMETINGRKYIIHQVDARETLYGISKRYGADLNEVLKANPQADAGLEVGQILKVPFVERPRPVRASGDIHTVVAQETLFSISRMYNVTIEELKQWNNLPDNSISVGQELVIRKNGTDTTPVIVAKTLEKGQHRVAAGETLYSISRTYNINVTDLKKWNNLTGSDLQVGQVLQVQSADTPGTIAVTQPVVKADETKVVPPVETTVKISEGVTGSDETKENGLAELIEGTEGNRKYLALHRTAPTGTILKVRNELNNREVFVRVVGPLPPTGVNDKLIVKISKSAFDRLGAIDPKFRVEVTYYK